jgi:hypothetical protein
MPQIKGIGICDGQFPAAWPKFLAKSPSFNVIKAQLILHAAVEANRGSLSETAVD